MKNKEIEELLDYMKQWDDLRIVVSYVEQLENKYESLLEDRKQLLNVVNILQKNRDKAIELVKSLIIFWKKYTPDNSLEIGQLENILNILKGDSE